MLRQAAKDASSSPFPHFPAALALASRFSLPFHSKPLLACHPRHSIAMASPLTGGSGAQQRRLLQAADDGNLPLFKRVARALDGGKGRIREAVEAVKDRGVGALHVAAGRGRMPVCAYLVEELQVDVNPATDSGDTPLSYAVRAGMVDTVKYLLDHGAEPNKPVGEGCTSLHLAVGEGKCEIVELLLANGADVNALSNLGTPLHVAAMENQDAAMKILLDHQADCNKEFFLFSTPLYTALEARSLNCVKLLIKAGVDVMKGNINPLLLAASKGLTDFYEVLLEAGADPDVRDVYSGLLPIEFAAIENRRKDVEILFPVTSRIPYVHDWSVDGIISHVKSRPTDEDDPTYKMELADLKVEGSKAFKRKDYSTAEKLYTIAIMKDASVGDATLFSNRSLCWIKMGEGDKALIDAEACRLMQPEWPKACYRQGAAHMFLKNYEKACDAFLDGLKLEPTDVEIENALREALNSLKISHAAKKLPESSSAVKET